jgi:hypothetical protein
MTYEATQAARQAAAIFMHEPLNDETSARYRAAVDRLASLLPEGADVKGTVLDAAQFEAKHILSEAIQEAA